MRWLLILNLAGLLAVSACQADYQPPPAPGSTATSTNQQVFHVKGVIMSLKPGEKEIVIKHEAVTNYMPAMTMPFDVKDSKELSGLTPGDTVSFRMIVTDTEGWIDQIQKVGPPATNAPPTSGPFRLVKNVEALRVGDPLPDYRFTNQFGQVIHTGQFKGQALAITFLFTRCPFPNFCPRMANNFAEAQTKLLLQATGQTNWHLLTLSFDPEFDTPAVLKAYAQGYRYDPQHWDFATGDLVDITAISEQLGLQFWHDETGSISHNLRAAVVDAAGKVQKIFTGNQWTSDELVAELIKAESASASSSAPAR
jgi:protein SCO1/2